MQTCTEGLDSRNAFWYFCLCHPYWALALLPRPRDSVSSSGARTDEAAESAPRDGCWSNMLVPSLSGIPVDDNSPVDVNTPPSSRSKESAPPYALLGRRSTWLRSFGTFALRSGWSCSIPHNAEVLREGCVPVPS
jgi:hypothetical protein